MAENRLMVPRTFTPRSAVERRFWATTGGQKIIATERSTGSSGLSSAYSFFILDLATNTIVETLGLDPADRTDLALYQFPMAPQQYSCSEPASTVITPTQDGGKFIESHGSLFKDIRISGTVGFRPSPASTELFPGLGQATGVQITVPGSNDERGLSPKEATGFDDIIFLRNIFRAYWDSKQTADARRWALVWVYAKESESYVVEPMQFETTRDAGKPLSWNYNIQLRTLYPLGYSFSVLDDSMSLFGGISKLLGWAQSIAQSFRDIGRFINQMSSLANYIVRLPFSLMNSIIGGAVEILGAIADLNNSMDFSKWPKDTCRQWKNDLKNGYDLITGVSNNPTIPTDDVASTTNPNIQSPGIVDLDIRALFRDAMRSANSLLTNDFLNSQSHQVTVKDQTAAYLDKFGESPPTAGSPLNVANLTIPNSAAQVIVKGNDTIKSIAQQYLGDESYWKLIAIINNLIAPYISSVRSQGVLAYGDPILIPKGATAAEAYSGVARTTNPDERSEAQTPVMKRYGRDIRLVSTDESDPAGDLTVNQRGDIALIDGVDNVYQAIMIKFSTEQGELATHPTFGAKYPIGTKFPNLSKLQEFSLNTQKTLRQDPRVEEIEDIKILAVADQLQVNAKVKMRGSDTQLPISLVVRR